MCEEKSQWVSSPLGDYGTARELIAPGGQAGGSGSQGLIISDGWRKVRMLFNKEKRRARLVNGNLIFIVDRRAQYKERLAQHNKWMGE